jgi:type III restriction enzyme
MATYQALKEKRYQEDALTTLQKFLEASRVRGVAAAFRTATEQAYHAGVFPPEAPCVCLRIPTGGGKTVLGARAIPLLSEYFGGGDAPVVLWLTPSEAILSQTLNALKTEGHPYREQLATVYNGGLTICGLDETANIPVPDWGQRAIVIVATIQSFRIEETDKRRVYSFTESFENHFKTKTDRDLAALNDLPDALVSEKDIESELAGREMLRAYLGKPKRSLANWLALQRPIIIVDEAHNAKTDKSFTTLARLNPSSVLELTATPIAGKTNVLYHVSAQQLQAESMIKMPIMLAEHVEGWERAVSAAIHTQASLESAARKEDAAGRGYIRPIVLFQATNENGVAPPEKLRTHLENELKVPTAQIAVATGATKELEDVDLFSRNCEIRFVITVQALREGWDCAFAYVLCSLQSLSSATAVEQLLGRVLRMPYASARGEPALNRAYAHVSEKQLGTAAKQLTDRLVDNMGFDPLDVAGLIAPAQQEELPLGDQNEDWTKAGEKRAANVVTPVFTELPTDAFLPPCVEVKQTANEPVQVSLRGYVSSEAAEQIVGAVNGAKAKAAIETEIVRHNAIVQASASPASLGLKFGVLPRLAFRDSEQRQASLELLDREAVLENIELDLLSPSAIDIGRFDIASEPQAYSIDIGDAGKMQYAVADAAQIPMDYSASKLTADDIGRWLDQQLYKTTPYLVQAERRAYCVAVVNHLVNAHGYELGYVAGLRHLLKRRIEAKLSDVRSLACRDAFKQFVLNQEWEIAADWDAPFEYTPINYPAAAMRRYAGRFSFKKHYFATIDNLKADGEEFECAKHIDSNPNVKSWIRNLEDRPGFWLPTSRYKFYPDFIVHLHSGRMVVIEYKGAHLRNDPAEIEKRQVGLLWAEKSGAKCGFGFVFKKGDKDETMNEQVNRLLS